MSRGFVKEGDQEDTPIVTPRAALPAGTVNYITPTGLELLKQEREALMDEQEANKENRVQYNYLTAKVLQIDERINSAIVVSGEKMRSEEVRFGAWVTYLNGKGQQQTIRIVGVDEADARNGKISFLSPLARVLFSHKEGDTVEFQRPNCTETLTIIAIAYGEEGTTEVAEIVLKKEKKEEKSAENSFQKSAVMQETAPVAATTEEESAEIEPEEEVQESHPQHDDDSEFLPIVNERGNLVGRALRWQCHEGNKMMLHPVVHLHIINAKGEVFLQKRPEWKRVEPGKWDAAVGGHVQLLEKPEAALQREAAEELSLKGFKAKLLKTYLHETALEKELVYVYLLRTDAPLSPTAETAGGRFWSRDEIKANLKKRVFTPAFEKEWKLVEG